jgi:hypothetical protein
MIKKFNLICVKTPRFTVHVSLVPASENFPIKINKIHQK